MHPMPCIAATLVLAVTGVAQSTHVIPNGLANVEGNTANLFPWGRGATASLQTQHLYDSANFTATGIDTPILITRLRWRADSATATWSAIQYTNATVSMASMFGDALNPSPLFANNLRADEAMVFSGPVSIAAGSGNGAGVPGPWVVELPLMSPFLYSPTQDLVIACDLPPGTGTGTGLPLDVQSTGSLSSRVYNSTSYGSGSGTVTTDHGVVVELTYERVQQLDTVLAANNSGSSGGGVYFDLAVGGSEGVQIHGLSLNTNWAVGSTGTVDVYVRPGTAFGFEASPAGWRQVVSAAPCIADGDNQPTRTAFPPVVLPPGPWGVAVSLSGSAAIGQRYSNGTNTYGDDVLRITTGTASNTLFAPTVIQGRTWNGAIYYRPAGRVLETVWDGNASYSGAMPGIMFDLISHHRGGLRVTGFDIDPNGPNVPDTISVWIRRGSVVGNERTAAGWRQVVTNAPFTNSSGNRLHISLSTPFRAGSGTTGVCVAIGSLGLPFRTGIAGSGTFSDGTLDLVARSALSDVFNPTSAISPATFVGSVHYQIVDPDGAQLQFNEPFGTSVGNSAVHGFVPAQGTVSTTNWQGDPGRAEFRGNEPGVGMLARTAAIGCNLCSIAWPMPLSGSMTMMWWQRLQAPASTSQAAYLFGTVGGVSERIFTGGMAGNSLVYRGSPIGDIAANGDVQANLGAWQHVALVVDDAAGVARWYIDGVLDATRTFTPNTHTVIGSSIFVGSQNSTGATPFVMFGDLDDFRLYGVALSEVEVMLARGGENASAGTYGSSCGAGTIQASIGLPSVTMGGPTFALQLLASNPNQLFVNLIGLLPRATSPVSISSFFGPGCLLQTQNSALTLGVTDAAGMVSLPLPVPRNPLLVGLHVYSQFLVWPLGTGTATHGLDINLR